MTIAYDNTRALGIGERVQPGDYLIRNGEFLLIGEPEVGKIIMDDDTDEYRRSLTGDPYEAMFAELNLETEAGRTAFRMFCSFCQTLDRKQQDYGSGNINAFGEFGVIVRMNDKMERLKRLTAGLTPKNEAIEDTYLDIANYACIAMMLRRNLWK